jgi:hypothetical protein
MGQIVRELCASGSSAGFLGLGDWNNAPLFALGKSSLSL